MRKAGLLLLGLVPAALGAWQLGGIDFFLTNDFLIQSNDLANSRNQIYETLSVFAKYQKWSVGVTGRVWNFFKPEPNLTLASVRWDIYKKFLLFSSDDFSMQLGDFYALLGRGLVLAVLQNDKIFRERTLLGGDFRYRQGRLGFRILGGTLQDEKKIEKWGVFGSEFVIDFSKKSRIGGHLCYIDDIATQQNLGGRFNSSLSFSGNLMAGSLSYYGEGGYLFFKDGNRANGYGLFANLTYYKNGLTLMMEFKRYRHYDSELNNPPAADREDELNVLDQSEGIRIYLQQALLRPDVMFFLNLGKLRESGMNGYHVYGGVAGQDLWEKVGFSFSYGVRDVFYPVKKIDANFLFRISTDLSLEGSFRQKRYRNGDFEFNETDWVCQFSHAPLGLIFFQYQFSENKVIDRNHFYSAGIRINISSETYIEVIAGTGRGGEICAGGQCFLAQPFKGVKLSCFTTLK